MAACYVQDHRGPSSGLSKLPLCAIRERPPSFALDARSGLSSIVLSAQEHAPATPANALATGSPEPSRELRVFDPEARSAASSNWVPFGQKRPGIQVLGQLRQPAALGSEQQLEQRR